MCKFALVSKMKLAEKNYLLSGTNILFLMSCNVLYFYKNTIGLFFIELLSRRFKVVNLYSKINKSSVLIMKLDLKLV